MTGSLALFRVLRDVTRRVKNPVQVSTTEQGREKGSMKEKKSLVQRERVSGEEHESSQEIE